MSMTAMLGSEGPGVPITWRGRVYTAMPLNLKMEGAFEEWMKARGRQEIVALKPLLDADDFRAALAEFAALAPGKYTFWGKEGIKYRTTPAGTVKMFQLMLSAKHPSITEKTVMEMFMEEGEQIEAAITSFFPQASKETDETSTTTEATEGMEVLTPEQVAMMNTTTSP